MQTDFEKELTEFANAVGLIVALEQGDRITHLDAYKRVKKLWKHLKETRKRLDNGQNPLPQK